MNNRIIYKVIDKIYKKVTPKKSRYKISYSQSGEDLIIKYIFNAIGIKKPSYLDIGAHHPNYLNNTALFYQTGSTGINVEPDPALFKAFETERVKDVNLNIGISDKNEEINFYVMNDPTMSTFSASEVEHCKNNGNLFVERTEKVKVKTVQSILEQYAKNKFPELLTIDAEGIDELVLKSIDYTTNYPIVICTETISFSNTGHGIKNTELIEFIKDKGYIHYADTYINSIFVRKDRWEKGSV